MNSIPTVSFLLRVGLASTFLYAAIASFFDPYSWIGYFPAFMKGIVPDSVLLNGFSIYEILLSLWLLSGKEQFYAAILSALTIAGIIIFNLGLLDVIFRDFAILFSAAALAVLSYQKR